MALELSAPFCLIVVVGGLSTSLDMIEVLRTVRSRVSFLASLTNCYDNTLKTGALGLYGVEWHRTGI